MAVSCFFFQAEDGIRGLVRSRGLGDVYKRQAVGVWLGRRRNAADDFGRAAKRRIVADLGAIVFCCLLYTSDAADERSSVDLGGRRIIKKKNRTAEYDSRCNNTMMHTEQDTEKITLEGQ